MHIAYDIHTFIHADVRTYVRTYYIQTNPAGLDMDVDEACRAVCKARQPPAESPATITSDGRHGRRRQVPSPWP